MLKNVGKQKQVPRHKTTRVSCHSWTYGQQPNYKVADRAITHICACALKINMVFESMQLINGPKNNLN